MIVETLLGGAGLALIGLGWLKSRPLEPRYRIRDASREATRWKYEYVLEVKTRFGWKQVSSKSTDSFPKERFEDLKKDMLSHQKRDIIFDSSQDSLEDLDTLFAEHLKGEGA